jgi:hypothetical protein
VLKVSCSDAAQVTLETHGRTAYSVVAKDAPLRTAEFSMEKLLSRVSMDDPSVYVYVTVTAQDGSYAVTRAYFLNELF